MKNLNFMLGVKFNFVGGIMISSSGYELLEVFLFGLVDLYLPI